MTPTVTVYITNHNYGCYVAQAIESVLHQKFDRWELIIIDDGSTDGSQEIIHRYEQRPNVRAVFQDNRGLPVASNIALRLARGAYIMRLDADDYLDENALLVLSNVLDTRPEIGLVYPDYYRVDEHGEVLSVERRNKAGRDVSLHDVPAHGACTMCRRECLLEVGGYSEEVTCQDGYDLWLKFIDRFGVYNVNVPLFYYRQHAKNLTRDQAKILRARRLIQRRYVARHRKKSPLNVVGIIPVRGRAHDEAAYALRPLAGRPLIDYTIEAAQVSEAFKTIVVISEDPQVLAHAQKFLGVVTIQRPPEMARPNTPIEPTIRLVFDRLQSQGRLEAFMLLYANSPLRKDSHIQHAVDTMRMFDVDSVISVYEDLSTHYQHDGSGLRPLVRRRSLRLEKEALWVENGAIYLARTRTLRGRDFLGQRVGHIVMLEQESLQIDTEHDFLIAEYLLTTQGREQPTMAYVQ